MLHAPSLPARERHFQYDTYIKVNYHNTISVTLARVSYWFDSDVTIITTAPNSLSGLSLGGYS